MTDHKFTDEEVIKALECCSQSGDLTKSQNKVCSPCPYADRGDCTGLLKANALALINRQNNALGREIYNSLKADEKIEHLKIELDAMRGSANSYKMHYENARAEAIKEFAEKLKETYQLCKFPNIVNVNARRFNERIDYCIGVVDKLAKEMTEVNNG